MANDDPVAYFITWTTYGTWLPGDERSWTDYREGWQLPSRTLETDCAARMTEDACVLSVAQRAIVEQQIVETCRFKGWHLHAAQCRTNHVHVVVSAACDPRQVRDQLKAWCTRRLNEYQAAIPIESKRTKWWTERGSIRWIWNTEGLARVCEYVLEQQDNSRRYG